MIQKVRQSLWRYLKERREINYPYFSLFLCSVVICSCSYCLGWEESFLNTHSFLLLYILGQAFLEVWAFVFIACVLKKWAPTWVLLSFISLSGMVFLLHIADFTLLRLMDAPISFAFKVLCKRGLEHLWMAFQSMNMNFTMIIMIITFLLTLPFYGLAVYWITNYFALKKPWTLSLGQITGTLLMTATCVLLLDFFAHPYLHQLERKKYHKSLPFGTTFFTFTKEYLQLPHPISCPTLSVDTLPVLQASHKPNLYFFVIETFRKDFITESITPSLLSFGNTSLNFHKSFSNANWTALSWFALFHSNLPHHWAYFRDEWEHGSIPLRLFKQLGYKIHAYSSANLRYFNMDQLLFGKNLDLLDSMEDFFHQSNLEIWEKDQACIDTFAKHIAHQKENEGHVYLFFLDSPHSEYSFPIQTPLKFEPITTQLDYLTVTQKEMEPLKNRYRNALSHIDHLFDKFITILKKENLFENAMIVLTGDHGEEFFEEGALFHGTHLNKYQTEVPIFLKIPNHPTCSAKSITHIDIFPSLLDSLTHDPRLIGLFDGTSIFQTPKSPYRIAVSQNGGDPPREFSIETEGYKLHVRIPGIDNIYQQTEVEVTQLEMPQNSQNLSLQTAIETYFPHALDFLYTPHISEPLH